MNFRIIIITLCFFIGIAWMWLYFSSFSNEIEIKSDQAESINLAIRQVAHNLYSINNDSTSTIPPVYQKSNNHFSIELRNDIHYDTLPFFINQAFLDFNISSKYKVTIKNCGSDDIILGYNYLAFEKKQIACVGRDHNSKCSIIGVTFLETEAKNYTYLVLSVMFFLGGFGSLFKIRKTSIPNMESIINQDEDEKKILQLGSTFFSPESLKVEVNENVKTLTFREAKLLEYFFSNPQQVLSRDNIKLHVWEDEGVTVGRSVDVFVSRLRKILNEDVNLEIKNIHGVGYRLEVKN